MAFSDGCLKFFVAGANFTFALAGLALIIVGVLYKLNIDHFTNAIPDEYTGIGWAPILTIVIGSVIFVIAFFGCCGAIKESPCLLTTYGVILLVIFLLQVALGVYAFLAVKDKDNFHDKVTNTINRIFDNYRQSQELPDLIQKELKCCGTTGPLYWIPPHPAVPSSCFKEGDLLPFTTGCTEAFYDFLNNSLQIIGITVLALSALEVVGCIFSLCLSSSIKNRERRYRY